MMRKQKRTLLVRKSPRTFAELVPNADNALPTRVSVVCEMSLTTVPTAVKTAVNRPLLVKGAMTGSNKPQPDADRIKNSIERANRTVYRTSRLRPFESDSVRNTYLLY